jgi:hypothetical protein
MTISPSSLSVDLKNNHEAFFGDSLARVNEREEMDNRILPDTSDQTHKIGLWPNITDWVGLKKKAKGAGRPRQDSPPIPNYEHFAVAVQVGYGSCRSTGSTSEPLSSGIYIDKHSTATGPVEGISAGGANAAY